MFFVLPFCEAGNASKGEVKAKHFIDAALVQAPRSTFFYQVGESCLMHCFAADCCTMLLLLMITLNNVSSIIHVIIIIYSDVDYCPYAFYHGHLCWLNVHISVRI